jgi:hypothetical protein
MDLGDGSGSARHPAITDRGGRKLSPFHRKGNPVLRTIEILAYTATWFYIGAVCALSFF